MSEHKASMKAAELSVEIRDTMVSRHKCGEGQRKCSAALKVPMSSVASAISAEVEEVQKHQDSS